MGKTTLAFEAARAIASIYLDLQSELYLADHLDKLVIPDEVHRAPGLLPVLRGLIDQARREGKQVGQYLRMGSASRIAAVTLRRFWTTLADHQRGAEVDLLLAHPGEDLWAVEIKCSLSPKVERGFQAAYEDLSPMRELVVYPNAEPIPLGNDVYAMPLEMLCRELAKNLQT